MKFFLRLCEVDVVNVYCFCDHEPDVNQETKVGHKEDVSNVSK